MLLAVNSYLAGGLGFAVGALLVFMILRWKEQTLRKARALEAQSILDNARRDAESALREAKLRASEDALKLRQETEQSFSARQKQITESEARLAERETLVSNQLQNLVTQENVVRNQAEDLQKQNTVVESQKQELASAIRQRLDTLGARHQGERRRVGTDHHAGHQEADHDGKTGPVAGPAHQTSHQHDHRQILDEIDTVHGVPELTRQSQLIRQACLPLRERYLRLRRTSPVPTDYG